MTGFVFSPVVGVIGQIVELRRPESLWYALSILLLAACFAKTVIQWKECAPKARCVVGLCQGIWLIYALRHPKQVVQETAWMELA